MTTVNGAVSHWFSRVPEPRPGLPGDREAVIHLSHAEIPEDVHSVGVSDRLVPALDKLGVHVRHIQEGSPGVGDDVDVADVDSNV